MNINTPLAVFFEDGEKITRKDGKFQKQDDKFLHIKTGETTHSIPLNRIVRLETTGVGE